MKRLLFSLIAASVLSAIVGISSVAAVDYDGSVTYDTPISFVKLGETSGVFADSSGNSNTFSPCNLINSSACGGANQGASFTYHTTSILPDASENSVTGISTARAQGPTGWQSGHTANWAIEAWFAPTTASTGSVQTIVRYYGGANCWTQVYLDTTGHITGVFRDDSGTQTTLTGAALSNGAVHHVVLTNNNDSTLRLYLDGSQSNSSALSSTTCSAGSNNTFLAGQEANGAASFIGKLQNVALYQHGLSATQVSQHFNGTGGPPTPTPTSTPTNTATPTPTNTATPTPTNTATATPTATNTVPPTPTPTATPTFTPNNQCGVQLTQYEITVSSASPYMWWRMGQCMDNAGTGGPATLSGASATTQGNTAIGLAGASNYHTTASSSTTGANSIPSSTITMEAWVYIRGTPNATGWYIVSHDKTLGTDCFMRVKTDLTVDLACTDGTVVNTNFPIPSTNSWHMIDGVIDATNGRAWIYIDAVQAAFANTISTNRLGSNVGWQVGSYQNSTAGITGDGDGDVQEVSIYSSAFSASEVANHYAIGSGISSAPGQMLIDGHVCVVANAVTNFNGQPQCASAQAPSYLAGSLILAEDRYGTQLGSGVTDSAGHYSFTSLATFGGNLTVRIAIYGPGATAGFGWYPLGGSYTIPIPQYGPLQNQALDFEYVVPEAANSTWWNVTFTTTSTSYQVPCLNIAGACNPGGTGGGGAFGAVGVAIGVPVFGAIGLPTTTDKPLPPGVISSNTFKVDVANPTSNTSTIIVSDDNNPPIIGQANTTTILVPGQQTTTIPVVGTGGFSTTIGEVVVVNTQPLQALSTTIQQPVPGPAPITQTGQTTNPTIGATTCGSNSFNLWSGLGPMIECLFTPTLTYADLFMITDANGQKQYFMDALYTKVGFTDVFQTAQWICGTTLPTDPCNPAAGFYGRFQGGACQWDGYIPWYEPTLQIVDTITITFVVYCTDPIPTIIRNFTTFGIILWGLISITTLLLNAVDMGQMVDNASDDEIAGAA